MHPVKRRRKELDPSTIALGWPYAIRKALLPALDIKGELRTYKSRPSRLVWSQGDPPSYAFKRGDRVGKRDGWHIVQVTAIDRYGDLTIALFKRSPKARRRRPEEPLYLEISRWLCSQADFADYLRTAALPGTVRLLDLDPPADAALAA